MTANSQSRTCQLHFVFFMGVTKKIVTTTHSVVTQSLQYLCGLLQAVRNNMEQLTEVIP
jgi:hypothetical protein